MRTLLTAVTTALVCALLFAGTGTSTTATYKTIRMGDYVSIPALDLSCSTWRRNPGGTDPESPGMYCGRASTKKSRAIYISKWRFYVTDRSESYYAYRANRSP